MVIYKKLRHKLKLQKKIFKLNLFQAEIKTTEKAFQLRLEANVCFKVSKKCLKLEKLLLSAKKVFLLKIIILRLRDIC